MPIDSDLKDKLWKVGGILIAISLAVLIFMFLFPYSRGAVPGFLEPVIFMFPFIFLPCGIVLILISKSKIGAAHTVTLISIIFFGFLGFFASSGPEISFGGISLFILPAFAVFVTGFLLPGMLKVKEDILQAHRTQTAIITVISLFLIGLVILNPVYDYGPDAEFSGRQKIAICCNDFFIGQNFCDKGKLPQPFKVDQGPKLYTSPVFTAGGLFEVEVGRRSIDCTSLDPGNDLQEWKKVCDCPTSQSTQ